MINLPITQRDWFVWTALHYVGHWYKWGGDDASGFDCSGLVIECGKSCDLFPRGGWDATAAQIYELLKKEGYEIDVANGEPGSLVFYSHSRKPSDIYHVEICVGGDLYVGASGGDSSTTTVNRAIQQNAFIKVRPIRDAKFMFYVDPF